MTSVWILFLFIFNNDPHRDGFEYPYTAAYATKEQCESEVAAVRVSQARYAPDLPYSVRCDELKVR